MKNKGFTLTEVLAVIVILGILASVATVGITRYTEEVRNKELINLHSTIEVAYNTYRSDTIVQGGIPSTEIDFSTISDEDFKYFNELSYNGERLTKTYLT